MGRFPAADLGAADRRGRVLAGWPARARGRAARAPARRTRRSRAERRTRSGTSSTTRDGRRRSPGSSRGSRSSRTGTRSASPRSRRRGGTRAWRVTGRRRNWRRGSWEGTASGQVAAHRAGRQGHRQAGPAGQGRHVGLHAEVPPGPVQPRPAVQAAQGRLAAVLGAGQRRLPGDDAAPEGRRVHARHGQAPKRVLRQHGPVRPPDQPGHRRHRLL